MFRLEVQRSFSAAHAIVIRGWREPLHGHDWHVTVTVHGPRLDADGLLVDFHWLEAQIDEVLGPWRNQNLNDCPPFAGGVNPTAENVCRHVGEVLSERLQTRAGNLPKDDPAASVRLASVRVTEAVGCAATYMPAAEQG